MLTENKGSDNNWNITDPSHKKLYEKAKHLLEARDNQDLYPNLLVRISGYSAYFNDLSPQMKDEIITRSFNAL